MPLLDTDFDKDFILVKEGDTIGAGLENLKAKGGQDTWHFFVARGEAEFGVIMVQTLKKLLSKLGGNLFALTFGELLADIPTASHRQQTVIGIGNAERLALKGRSGVLIVMREDEVAGRLFMAATKGRGDAVFRASTMSQLYGEYITQDRDARAKYRPAGVDPPLCPHCNYQDFYDPRVEDGVMNFYCIDCDEIISQGD